ncbi:leucine-rich repeat domain-containing protein, partial [Candidatus Bipolaricaulota bacterium]|nr:leucine-rich repeat domain-containing protein [Candidatus Bipolaricaulota bacterium]
LKGLWLNENEIVDISALSGLTDLDLLGLGGNQIVDISALSGLINLAELDLSHNQIVDISALSGLTNLDSLGLGSNQIVGIAPLVNNTGIGSGDDVDLDDNPLHLFESGSPNSLDLEALRQRGASVTYQEECDTCGD